MDPLRLSVSAFVNALFITMVRDLVFSSHLYRHNQAIWERTTNPRETMMNKIIKFRPRVTNGKSRTYKKAADVIPMPARKVPEIEKVETARRPTLADMLDLTWPRATD